MNHSRETSRARRIAVGIFGIVAIFVVLIAGFVAWAFHSAGWGSDEPDFYEKDGLYQFDCLNEVTGEPGSIAIEFTQNGRKARVINGDQSTVLDFEIGGLAGDNYVAGEARLMIDPEVYIRGIGKKDYGPCQRM